MSKSIKQTLRKEYSHLKNVLQKVFAPKKEKALSQLVLQPVRHKRNEG